MAAEYLDLAEEDRDKWAWFFGNLMMATGNWDSKKMPQLKQIVDGLRGKVWIQSKEDLKKFAEQHHLRAPEDGTRSAGRNHNAV